MSEINKREVLELMRQDGNDHCADCGKKGKRVNNPSAFLLSFELLCMSQTKTLTGPPLHLEHSCAGIVAAYIEALAPTYRR